MRALAYFRLLRFHKPAGILLLWAPTAWALWIANQGFPSPDIFYLLFLGTIIMRAAGCVINDIADRDIDAYVKRTAKRPLATGELSLQQAVLAFVILLFLALIILLQLPWSCFYYALIALILTVIYPFCKRFMQGPQFILGLAFSMGIPIAFTASRIVLNQSFLLIFIINFLWIVAYDTQYAMVDRGDDRRIGVKSTAILFGCCDKLIIGILQITFHCLWFLLFFKEKISGGFIGAWLLGLAILFYQQILIRNREEKKCLRAFISNSWYGLIMWLGIILAYPLR